MKKCQSCGKNNVNNAKYCMDCGTIIDHKVTFHTKHYIELILMIFGIFLVISLEAPLIFALDVSTIPFEIFFFHSLRSFCFIDGFWCSQKLLSLISPINFCFNWSYYSYNYELLSKNRWNYCIYHIFFPNLYFRYFASCIFLFYCRSRMFYA